MRVVMIDDDVRLAQMVTTYLGRYGVEVVHHATAASGKRALEGHDTVDAVILDLMLPDQDGQEVCRELRAAGQDVPILMLTARGDPSDRVVGLELGADDYVPKPFDPREVLARLRAITRRARQGPLSGSQASGEVLELGNLVLDRGARQVRKHGEIKALTSHQFDLLWALASRAGRVLSREQIMRAVRERELEAFDRSIDVHISRIRAAIEDDPKQPQRIVTVRGVGYVFTTPPAVA